MKKSLLLVIIALLLGAAKAALDHELQFQINTQLAHKLPAGGVDYQNAYVSLQASVVVENLRVRRPELPPLHISRLEIPQIYRFANGLPTNANAILNGISMDLPDNVPDLAPLFTALGYGNYYLSRTDLIRLGYGKLRSDANLAWIHDAAAQQLQLKLQLDHGNLGIWRLALKIDNLPQLSAPLSINNLPLQLADLDWREQPVLNRALTDIARRQQQPLAELRQALAQQVRRDLSLLRLNLDEESLDAISALLRDDTPLHIQAVPPEPIPLQVLTRYLPFQWPALLGLRVRQGDAI